MAHWRLSVLAQTGAKSTGSPYSIPRGRKVILHYAWIRCVASAAGRQAFIRRVDATQPSTATGQLIALTTASVGAATLVGIGSLTPAGGLVDANYLLWNGPIVLGGLDQVQFTITGGTGADATDFILDGQEYEESEPGF